MKPGARDEAPRDVQSRAQRQYGIPGRAQTCLPPDVFTGKMDAV